ncbi:3164_t:CDS:2 [Funneliformis caledonium]|uniref:3164_t:CDS:1 n=1 Tax=Funneliformis caledonium TaxID=1117310 RepID=A0A9N9GJJ9_9GLOM|nr:3164_t:CDS:2 [Funneliformis caledonium]
MNDNFSALIITPSVIVSDTDINTFYSNCGTSIIFNDSMTIHAVRGTKI